MGGGVAQTTLPPIRQSVRTVTRHWSVWHLILLLCHLVGGVRDSNPGNDPNVNHNPDHKAQVCLSTPIPHPLTPSPPHPLTPSPPSPLPPGPDHEVEYDGDPLADFSLMPFLDKMAYKQNKAAPRRAGAARMGPSGKGGAGGELEGEGGEEEEPVNSTSFLAQEVHDVAPDQVLWYGIVWYCVVW